MTGDGKVVNVAQVKLLSPFRYPGGKTWLVPKFKEWMQGLENRPGTFVDPFAGGGIIPLTAAVFDLADNVVMAELDNEVAAIWQVILDDPEWLCRRILGFEVTLENVKDTLSRRRRAIREIAFKGIIRNRMQRGGIMAPGASLIKSGENGKGLKSRWYAETLAKRIRKIYEYQDKIQFIHGDGFNVIEEYLEDETAVFFIDPPYTAGGKKAGQRLYVNNEIDHERLFGLMAEAQGRFLMTYDDAQEVLELANSHNFNVDRVLMKSTHHAVVYELLITRGL